MKRWSVFVAVVMVVSLFTVSVAGASVRQEATPADDQAALVEAAREIVDDTIGDLNHNWCHGDHGEGWICLILGPVLIGILYLPVEICSFFHEPYSEPWYPCVQTLLLIEILWMCSQLPGSCDTPVGTD